MRTTVTLDDDLVADASAYCGITDKSKLINHALDALVKRMAAKRLVALGGTMPDLTAPARYRIGRDDSPAQEAARALAALGGTMPELELPARRKSSPAGGEKTAKVAEDPTPYPAKPEEGQP